MTNSSSSKPHRYDTPEATGAPYTVGLVLGIIGMVCILNGLFPFNVWAISIGLALFGVAYAVFRLTSIRAESESVTVQDGRVVQVSVKKRQLIIEGNQIRRLECFYANGAPTVPNLRIESSQKSLLVNGSISDFDGLMDELETLTWLKIESRPKRTGQSNAS